MLIKELSPLHCPYLHRYKSLLPRTFHMDRPANNLNCSHKYEFPKIFIAISWLCFALWKTQPQKEVKQIHLDN